MSAHTEGSQIVTRSLSVRYRASGTLAIADLTLDVAVGEIVALLGPSGCGKTTYLDLLASVIGAAEADISGTAMVGGCPIGGAGKPPVSIGYVYERDGLLPWRTLQQNVELGLEIRGFDRARRHAQVRQLMQEMDLVGSERALPYQLSSGMRQRAALARTFAVKPSVLFMDEPFGALDVHTRATLHRDVQTRWLEQRFTLLLVTHDVDEAITLSHRVVVLSRRPAKVERIVEVPFPVPRDPFLIKSNPEFQKLSGDLWRMLMTTK